MASMATMLSSSSLSPLYNSSIRARSSGARGLNEAWRSAETIKNLHHLLPQVFLGESMCKNVQLVKPLLSKNLTVEALFWGKKAPSKVVRETVIPEPDYRLPFVFLGTAGALSYGDFLLPAAPIGLIGLLLLFQSTRVRLAFDDEGLEVKVGQQLQESGENVFVGGKNRWSYSSFTNWELWWPNFPVLVYFKETQTKPEGQIHFFPILVNGKQLYDVMVERAGPSKTSAPKEMEVAASNCVRPAYLKYEDGVLLGRVEAEFIVQHLTTFPIEQVGSRKWLTQHAHLEKLNLQAHYNTMARCDEFVMVALISHDKMGVLIHELLVIELWKEKIFPIILKQIAADASTITLNLVMYQETTIINLLEIILYHKEVCEAMSSDALLELTDYCYRKLVYLNTRASEDAAHKEKSTTDLINMTPEDDLKEKAASMQFGIGVCSLTALRYLTDYMSDLPLSVMARMLDCHDVIMALVPLVQDSPWKRKRMRSNKLVAETYVEGKWIQVELGNRFKLTKPEAQLWLALYNLIVDTRCRLKYSYDDFRREQVLKLRKHLNDTLMDQLPILKDLKWIVEELVLHGPSSAADKTPGRLIIEQVPELREKLLFQKNWKAIAQMQLEMMFSSDSEATVHEQAQEMLRLFQFGEMMEQPTCAVCGANAVQRCSRCKTEWYCGRKCQVSVWKTHKSSCDLLADKMEK